MSLESRLRKSNNCPSNVKLPNYVIKQFPTQSQVGVTPLYINKKYSHKRHIDLNIYKHVNLNHFFVEIVIPKKPNMIEFAKDHW